MTTRLRARATRLMARVIVASTLSATICLVSDRVSADISPPGGVHINEVRYLDTESPDDVYLDALVELYNKNSTSTAVGGWTIRDHAGTIKATLPAVSIPSDAILVVSFSMGVDDLDFSDGVGTVYTNTSTVNVFDHSEDGVALYDGGAVIQDYVTWSLSGTPAAGTALSDAVVAGLWSPTDFVPVDPGQRYFTIRLVPDGYDNNASGDWSSYGWGESVYGGHVPGSNPLQISPSDGTASTSSSVTLSWTSQSNAVSYHLEVSTDPTFTTPSEVDVTTGSTSVTVALSDGTHYWRVRINDVGGAVTKAVTWLITVFTAPPPPATFGLLGVVRETQHKDTRLLCLYDDANGARPGCTEAAGDAGPWDDAHPADHAEHGAGKVQCPHCRNYCARASTQMINHFYGGDLSQDRISFNYMDNLGERKYAAPEGDLGHDIGVRNHAASLQWAVQNSNVIGPNAPTYALIKAEIVAGFPVFVGIPGHVMVVDGYLDANSFFGFPAQNMIHVNDPWPTSTTNGWVNYNAVGLNRYWQIRQAGAAALAGRTQEATVTQDTDGDGVVDFDEGAPNYPADRPRRLQSRHNKRDTDDDSIEDKKEIRSYTFHDTDHAGHENDPIGFPDVDADGLRAEADCDSDNDADFDGGEDINANGNSPEAGETCVYDKTSKKLDLTVSEALSCDMIHATPEIQGGTLGGSRTYDVEVKETDCTPPAAGTALANSGTIHTDASGNVDQNSFSCLAQGTYRIIIDATANGTYDPGCDPVLCLSFTTCMVDCRTRARFGNEAQFSCSAVANDPGGRFRFGKHAFMTNGTELIGDTVQLLSDASVFDAFYNDLHLGSGATIRDITGTPTLPFLDPFPVVPPFTCAGPDVTVPLNQAITLPPGTYNRVSVLSGGSLTLDGDYDFCSLRTSRGGDIFIAGTDQTTIDIAGTMRISDTSILEPLAGTPGPIIDVAGRLVRVGRGSELDAFMTAPNAFLTVGKGGQLKGSFVANRCGTDKDVSCSCDILPPVTTTTTTTTSSTTTTTLRAALQQFAKTCADDANITLPNVLPNQTNCSSTQATPTDCNGWEIVGPQFKGSDDLASLNLDDSTAQLYQWKQGQTTCFYLYRVINNASGAFVKVLNGVLCFNNTDKKCNVCALDYPKQGAGSATNTPTWNDLLVPQEGIEDCSGCHAPGTMTPKKSFKDAASGAVGAFNDQCSDTGGPNFIGAPGGWTAQNGGRKVAAPSDCNGCHTNGFVMGPGTGATNQFCEFVLQSAFADNKGAMKAEGNVFTNGNECRTFRTAMACTATQLPCPGDP